MAKFPNNLDELKSMFPTEKDCRDYLHTVRWKNGVFHCPKCNCNEAWRLRSSGLMTCKDCRHQTSVIAGTFFDGTHQPLSKWFLAFWWVAAQKEGTSATGLQNALGISYKTAWIWLQKIRRVMILPGVNRFSGCFNLEETSFGAVNGSRTKKQIRVLVATRKMDERKHGGIRIRRIPENGVIDVLKFVDDFIEPGSIIRTKNKKLYDQLRPLKYNLETLGTSRTDIRFFNLVDGTIDQLKKWLSHLHPYAFSYKHLDYYLDEFSFRTDRWAASNTAYYWNDLIKNAMIVRSPRYGQITGKHKEVGSSNRLAVIS